MNAARIQLGTTTGDRSRKGGPRRSAAIGQRCAAILFVALAVIAPATWAAAQSRQLPLVTTSGDRSTGRLREISPDWRFTIEQPAGAREFAASELVRWGHWRERADGLAVLLPDGGILRVEDWSFAGDHLVLPESPTGIWRAARWPRDSIKALVFQWPAAALDRDQLVARLLSTDSRQDEVWLEGGDRLQGTLDWTSAAAADGGGEEAGADRWRVRTRAGDVPVARQRVVAVAWPGKRDVANDQPSAGGAWLATRDGSCLKAGRLTRRGDLVELELAGGLQLVCDAASLWDELRYVQPLTHRVTYLSDLTAIGYKHLPYLSQTWDWNRDRSVVGGFLRSGGAVYRRGLGLHSSARLAYDLAEGYEWFCAELAIDERAGRGGSVICRVYTDGGDGQWRAAYESPVVRGGAEPLPVRVDVRGVKRLALIVDFADRGDELDYIDWLDARLVRPAGP